MISDKGGRGVSKFLILYIFYIFKTSPPLSPFLADIICEQPLTCHVSHFTCLMSSNIKYLNW